MPELARFYGIIIKMYFEEKEHNPPHVHARYGARGATVDISTGEILSGDLPLTAKNMVKEWVNLHSSEIKEVWETQKFKKIKPLE